jgi:copper homeostasis protein
MSTTESGTQRAWGVMGINLTNISYFVSGYLLREMVLHLKDGSDDDECSNDNLISQLVRVLKGSALKLESIGYTNFKPVFPLVLDKTVEACVSDLESALQAYHGGATSIELCVDRSQGGVTPSSALIEAVSRRLGSRGVQINVLIRPRAGSFVYTEDEFQLLQAEVDMALEAGATGVVVGILTEDGHIHQPRMRIIKGMCGDTTLTFHRAFDVCAEEPLEALRIVNELGCDRLLTSGRKDSVTHADGLALVRTLYEWSRRASPLSRTGAVQIVAGAGVTTDNVASVIRATGVTAVHSGSGFTRKTVHSFTKGTKQQQAATAAAESGGSLNAAWDEVCRDKVKLMVDNATAAWTADSLSTAEEAGTADSLATTIDGADEPGSCGGAHADDDAAAFIVVEEGARANTAPNSTYVTAEEDPAPQPAR